MGFWGSLSRETREATMAFIAPTPYLILLLILQRSISGLPTPVRLLNLSFLLAFTYVLIRRIIRLINTNLRKFEESRLPPKYEDYPNSIRHRFRLVRQSFYSAETNHPHITKYELQRVGPHLGYALLSSFETLAIWSILYLALGITIVTGIFRHLISLLRSPDLLNTVIPIFEQIIPNVILKLSTLLFEGITLENGVVLFVFLAIPGYFLITVALNLTIVSEELHRRFLKGIYNEGGILRQYEFPGYGLVLIAYILIFLYL